MMKRRMVLTAPAIVAAASLMSRRARAETFQLKWGHAMPATHPINVRGQEAAAAIAKETNGKVQVQIFPDNQLGGDQEMASEARSGSLEMYTAAPSSIGPLVPAATIINIPFAFPDAQSGWRALDGDLGAYVAAAFGKVGLTGFHTMWASGFREITSYSKPINSPADLRGFKIRVPNSPLLLTLFRSLGASPATLDVSEAYTALQTHLVDGEENPLAIIATRNFNEVQKYCAMTNHVWDVFIQTVNTNVWKSIPPNLQEIIRRNFAEAAKKQRGDVTALNASLRRQLEGKGMIFNTPDPGAFRTALRDAGVYGKWKKEYGPEAWGLLEQYTGALA